MPLGVRLPHGVQKIYIMIQSLKDYLNSKGEFKNLSIERDKPIFNCNSSIYCGLPILEQNTHPTSNEHIEIVLDWESVDNNKDIQYRKKCCNITWILIDTTEK